MGFRPLYLCRLCLGLDLGAALGPRAFAAARRMNELAWHAHEMLWGVATIAVGFLLTAGANWTGRNPLRGNALAALCLVWLAARAGTRSPSGLPAGGHSRSGVLFLWGAAALGRSVWLTRNKRNYGVPLLLAALASAHLLYPDGRRLRRLPGPDALLQRRPAQHGRADPADRAPRAALLRQRAVAGHTFRRIPGAAIGSSRPAWPPSCCCWPAARPRAPRWRGRQRPDRAGPVAGLQTLGRAACRCCGSCTPATWA